MAASSIHRCYSPRNDCTAELVSLSPRAITLEKNGKTLWTPGAGAIEFKPIEGAREPDASARQRLVQMRNLAREYSAELTDRRVVAQGTPQQLRLLDQPVFKYGPGGEDPAEGALFAFVVATDPEVILAIETRESESSRAWHYALARMNRDGLRVRHKDNEVWTVPYLEKPWSDIRAPYILFGIDVK